MWRNTHTARSSSFDQRTIPSCYQECYNSLTLSLTWMPPELTCIRLPAFIFRLQKEKIFVLNECPKRRFVMWICYSVHMDTTAVTDPWNSTMLDCKPLCLKAWTEWPDPVLLTVAFMKGKRKRLVVKRRTSTGILYFDDEIYYCLCITMSLVEREIAKQFLHSSSLREKKSLSPFSSVVLSLTLVSLFFLFHHH